MEEYVVNKLNEHAPLVSELQALKGVCWINPDRLPIDQAVKGCPLTLEEVKDAEQRLHRFAPYLAVAFPETAPMGGILESPLREISGMKKVIEEHEGCNIPGRIWLKMDSHLPISGSIKARGGIYEVLKIAEDVALKEGLLTPDTDYRAFASEEFRRVFGHYQIAVGSTGNLGLSIGIMSAALGFHVTVHMSADARQWKKDMLREKGVHVVEYAQDYSVAVAEGREQANKDPRCHFVDDENSQNLFLGYAVAGLRLKKQLAALHISVDREHPLIVYLPCGVGGGPGGVAFGLSLVFGDHVFPFFAEPTHSCCMLLGMSTGLHQKISVQDIGIDNRTAADGLAVGRASGFVGKTMMPFMDGCYTLSDERMYTMLCQLTDSEQIRLEPSALAGMFGPVLYAMHPAMLKWQQARGINGQEPTHIVWATGGSMVPDDEHRAYYEKGKALLSGDK